MGLLDYDFKSEEDWIGATGGSSRLLLFELENFKDEPATAQLIRVADPANATPASRPGWHKFQSGLNPESELGVRPEFIENTVLTGNLTARAGKSGRRSPLGTLNLPLTSGIGVFIRNILQSRNNTDGSITYAPATITGTGKLTADVFGTAPALQPGSTKTIASAFTTELTAKTYPVRLELKVIDQDIADVAAGGRGVITITGTDNWDNVLTHNIIVPRVAADDTDTTFKVPYHWKEVTSVASSGFAATTGGTFQIEAFDTAQKVTLKPYDGRMVSYLLASMDVGDVPRFVRGMYAASANLIIPGPNALVRLEIGIGGRSGHLRQRPTPDYYIDKSNNDAIVYKAANGTYTPARVPADDVEVPQELPEPQSTWTDAQKTAFWATDYRLRQPSEVEIISSPVMDSNRVELAIGTSGIRVPIRSLNFDFGIRFEESGTITDPSENPPPGRRSRQPIMSGEYTYSKSDNLDVSAINDLKPDFLKATITEQGLGAFPEEYSVECRVTQIQEIGTPRTVDGEMGVSFSMLGLPSDGSTGIVADDVTFEMVVPESQNFRNYT